MKTLTESIFDTIDKEPTKKELVEAYIKSLNPWYGIELIYNTVFIRRSIATMDGKDQVELLRMCRDYEIHSKYREQSFGYWPRFIGGENVPKIYIFEGNLSVYADHLENVEFRGMGHGLRDHLDIYSGLAPTFKNVKLAGQFEDLYIHTNQPLKVNLSGMDIHKGFDTLVFKPFDKAFNLWDRLIEVNHEMYERPSSQTVTPREPHKLSHIPYTPKIEPSKILKTKPKYILFITKDWFVGFVKDPASFFWNFSKHTKDFNQFYNAEYVTSGQLTEDIPQTRDGYFCIAFPSFVSSHLAEEHI